MFSTVAFPYSWTEKIILVLVAHVGKEESHVWTNSEVLLFLHITLDYKVRKF